jgi:hypothetical protein
VAAQWRSGYGQIEFLDGDASDDLAWLTFIERAVVVLRDSADEQHWDLRVTGRWLRSRRFSTEY